MPKGHYAPTFSASAEIHRSTNPVSFAGQSGAAAAGVAPARQPAEVLPEVETSVVPPLAAPTTSPEVHLTNFFARADHPFRVKRSLLLNWDDVKTENIIILGSPAENLFLRQLPQAQDFAFRFNKELRLIELINLKPRPGEAEILRPRIDRVKGEGPTTISISEDYALVSLIKGIGQQNRLLILAGITTHGTQAAAEYVTKPEYVKDFVAHLNTSKDPAHPVLPESFQAVLKVKVNGGVPVQISYVTHHVLQ